MSLFREPIRLIKKGHLKDVLNSKACLAFIFSAYTTTPTDTKIAGRWQLMSSGYTAENGCSNVLNINQNHYLKIRCFHTINILLKSVL